VEDIVKFTRKLDFFRNMAEVSREELCRSMSLVSRSPGAVISRSSDPNGSQPWHIVIAGRLAVMSSDVGGMYPVWFFESGQTFGRSYLNLFSASSHGHMHCGAEVHSLGLHSHIETLSPVKYLQVYVPERLAPEFKVWTRPLWYEELAQYFHVGINEAAEALGICPSAIKRICRRHGLNRWPHRRIVSIGRNIANIQIKLDAAMRDESTDASLVASHQADIMENVRNKILSRCNLGAPDGGLLPDEELIDDDKIGDDNAPVNTTEEGCSYRPPPPPPPLFSPESTKTNSDHA